MKTVGCHGKPEIASQSASRVLRPSRAPNKQRYQMIVLFVIEENDQFILLSLQSLGNTDDERRKSPQLNL